MLNKINLFPKIESTWKKRAKIKRWLQIASVVVLILYFVGLSSLLSYSLFLNKKIQSLQTKIEASQQKIKNLKSVESKHLLFKTKLQELVKIFKEEESKKASLVNLDEIQMSGVSFSSVVYGSTGVKIEGTAENVLVLDKFVRQLKTKAQSLFSQAQIENIRRTKDGDYKFTLSFLI